MIQQGSSSWRRLLSTLPAAMFAAFVAFAAFAASPTVSLDVAETQADPTNASPIVFEASFSEPVTGFDSGDVIVSGTGGPGVVVVTTADDTVFTIEVVLAEDGTEDGIIVVSIPAGVCASVSTAEPNSASTSLDHDVHYDTTPPPEPANAWPSNGSILSDTSPTFSWAPVDDEAGGSGLKNYRVTIVGPVDRDTYKTTTTYTPQLEEGDLYAWRVYARDRAGNVSSYHWMDFLIDASAPVNPTVSSPSHAPDVWSAAPNMSIAVAGDAWDLWTNVDGFETAWNRSSGWTGSGVTNRAPSWGGAVFTTTSDGDWWFHLATVDLAGNWSDPFHLGPFRIDATAPADLLLSSASHTVNTWSSNSAIEVEVGVDDAGSGVDGFEIEWDQNAEWVPDGAKDMDETWPGGWFTAVSDGDWYIHVAAVDHAGNWTNGDDLGPFRIDTGVPLNPDVRCPSHEVDTWSNDPRVAFAGFETANDARSGVAGCSVEWVSATTGIVAEQQWVDASSDWVAIDADDGAWYLRYETADAAGNTCLPGQMGPYCIDTAAPIIVGIPANRTMVLPYGVRTGDCSWEEPTAIDTLSGLDTWVSSLHPGDPISVGTTTVTYTATDRCGNSATASFDITVVQSAQQLSVVASGEAGGFLHRRSDLNEGQQPPMAGLRPLCACYTIGESITGGMSILDAAGDPCTSTYVIVSLYLVDIATEPEPEPEPERMELLDSWNAAYDSENECYRFEVDTSELAAGIYDLRLGFEDGSTAWIRVEVVEAAA